MLVWEEDKEAKRSVPTGGKFGELATKPDASCTDASCYENEFAKPFNNQPNTKDPLEQSNIFTELFELHPCSS